MKTGKAFEKEAASQRKFADAIRHLTPKRKPANGREGKEKQPSTNMKKRKGKTDLFSNREGPAPKKGVRLQRWWEDSSLPSKGREGGLSVEERLW